METCAALVLPSLVLLLSFLYLGFFERTKAESGRLWLFLVPMCCGLAAVELRDRYPAPVGPVHNHRDRPSMADRVSDQDGTGLLVLLDNHGTSV